MSPLAAQVPSAAADALPLEDDEFVLDMRVVETLTPRLADCDTGDGCGSSCQTTACNTGSADPV